MMEMEDSLKELLKKEIKRHWELLVDLSNAKGSRRSFLLKEGYNEISYV